MSEIDQPSAWEQIAPAMFNDARWAEASSEIDAAIALMGIAPPASVLDVACGPGRHVLELARRGFAVTGLDATLGFVRTAQDLAVTQGLAVTMEHADMRSFDLGDAFDAVVNLSTSFGYFADPEDDVRTLRAIHGSLKPGGILLMEMVGKEIAARTLQAPTWNEEVGRILLTEQRVSGDWTWLSHRLMFMHDGVTESFELGHRLYAASELRALLGVVGFRDIEVFGSLAGITYDERATALVVLARR